MSRPVRGSGERQEKWLKCLQKGLGFFDRKQIDAILGCQDNLRNFDLQTLHQTQNAYTAEYGQPHEGVARWIDIRHRQSSTWRRDESRRISEIKDAAAFLVGLMPE